ncbi:MAG: ion transporter [Candidatus Synoicihabitans palmerolidicus]|nr:ion transporter [Candidatus Synoicihabitans palmerolidicus]
MLPKRDLPEELGPFQFGILVLSLALLLGLAAEILLDLDPEIVRLIFIIDTAVCVLLLIDFGVRFKEAESKLQFMKWGWIDLIASIPAIDLFRLGRILRILIALRSLRRLIHILWRSKTSAGLTGAWVITFLVFSFGSTGVLMAEMHHPEADIRTAADALWWSITTIGYGDLRLVTTEGRIIASFLMIPGSDSSALSAASQPVSSSATHGNRPRPRKLKSRFSTASKRCSVRSTSSRTAPLPRRHHPGEIDPTTGPRASTESREIASTCSSSR